MAPSATVLEGQSEVNQRYGGFGKAKGKSLNIKSYPQFDTLEDERLYKKQHLAGAFRILAEFGFFRGIAGHISVRDPILTDHFWLNPISQPFTTLKVSDLVLVSPEGEVVIGDRPIQPAAFAIHVGILNARPDINSVCHAHGVHGKTYSAFGKEIEMLTQDSLKFYKAHTVYKNFGGIVFDRQEGVRIANALGPASENNKAVILQNHGILTVGQTPDDTTWWFLAMEDLCQVQLLADAAAAGSGNRKIIVNDEEAQYTYNQTGTPEKGWLEFQMHYDDLIARTGGDFLQ